MGTRLAQWMMVGVLLAAVSACGGGGGGDEPAAPPPVAAPPVIGAAGGSTSEASGASVIVPAGALAGDTTIRVAMNSSGAPPLPAGLVAAGNTYVVTPHGGEFAQAVEVRIPAPNVSLQPNQELKLAKAQPGGEWEVLADSQLRDGKLVAQVGSFSFFAPVTVTYILPLAQFAPFALTSSSLDCQGQNCQNLIGVANATFSVTTNNGQLPANCANGRLRMATGNSPSSLGGTGAANLPLTGGSNTRNVPEASGGLNFVTGLYCSGAQSHYVLLRSVSVRRASTPSYPFLAVVFKPAQIDVVAGLRANLDAVLNGGPSKLVAALTWAAPTPTNQVEIDWQRSDDGGRSWRVVARSFQHEADPVPMASTLAWRTWGVRHGFVASAADQGALIRMHACYTPPDVAPPPCVTSGTTRINVLQQSALPMIVGEPRSLLVRTGQTASFSASASGAPTPTLQWQTRAANATGAWTNVSSGTGSTGANFTTPVLGAADNGTQYRVMAENSLGSAASAAVTVSVSELDVAPTVTTQPASLSVTAGSDAAFAIAARGTEALSYQWRKDGVALAGANGPVLRLAAVTAGQAGSYQVTVSNAAGTATSDPAQLSVSAGAPAAVAPTIVTQPVSVLVNAGNTATFAVGASGSGSLIYQWLRNGQAIAGATAAFFSIAQAAVGDAATYAVQVSNGVGAGVTSFNVVLTVNASVQVAPVALLTQPSAQVQTPGGSATFAVAVSGSAPISYQWLKNGAAITGATSAVLTLIGVNGSDAANYSVTVSNPLLSVTSDPASLTVIGAPLITAQPAAASVSEAGSATFSASASGSALLYQWTRNGAALAGATSASHTTPALTLADSGAVYRVLVFNGAGVAFSQGAVLTVTPLVAPTVSTQPLSQSVVEPAAATFTVGATGTPALTLQWQLSSDGGASWADIAGATASSYTTAATAVADSGRRYRAVVSNSSGTVNSNGATLTVTALVVARAWRSPALIENSNLQNQRPEIASDASGNALVVWQQRDSTTGFSIWANRFTAATNTWSAPARVEPGISGTAEFPQVAVDASGNAFAVWYQNGTVGSDIWTNRYTAATNSWGTAALVETNAIYAQIAVDSVGNALLVWNRYSGAIGSVWAKRHTAGTGWSTAARIETGGTNSAGRPQIAIDANGNALAVWNRFNGSSRNDIWANRYTAFTNTWGTAVLIETGNAGTAESPQIAVDANGNGVALWNYFDGARYDLMAAHYVAATGTWGPAAISLTASAGSAGETRVAFDALGNAIAVWDQSNANGPGSNIWANRFTPSAGWGTAALIETNDAGSAGFARIAIDGSGNALVVWRHEEGFTRSDIWANRYTVGTGWGAAALIEFGNAGSAQRPQIAMDGNGNAIAVWEQFDGSHVGIWASGYR